MIPTMQIKFKKLEVDIMLTCINISEELNSTIDGHGQMEESYLKELVQNIVVAAPKLPCDEELVHLNKSSWIQANFKISAGQMTNADEALLGGVVQGLHLVKQTLAQPYDGGGELKMTQEEMMTTREETKVAVQTRKRSVGEAALGVEQGRLMRHGDEPNHEDNDEELVTSRPMPIAPTPSGPAAGKTRRGGKNAHAVPITPQSVGRRAVLDPYATNVLIADAINELKNFQTTNTGTGNLTVPQPSIEDRLAEASRLLQQGILTEEEYKTARSHILSSL